MHIYTTSKRKVWYVFLHRVALITMKTTFLCVLFLLLVNVPIFSFLIFGCIYSEIQNSNCDKFPSLYNTTVKTTNSNCPPDVRTDQSLLNLYIQPNKGKSMMCVTYFSYGISSKWGLESKADRSLKRAERQARLPWG